MAHDLRAYQPMIDAGVWTGSSSICSMLRFIRIKIDAESLGSVSANKANPPYGAGALKKRFAIRRDGTRCDRAQAATCPRKFRVGLFFNNAGTAELVDRFLDRCTLVVLDVDGTGQLDEL